jgi:hypothetical protein
MEGKTLLRAAVVVTCLALTALGYRNSNGDNTDAVALATKAACSGEGCSVSLGQQSRSSFGGEYSFSVTGGKGDKPGVTRQVVVACQRELIFIGDWKCTPKTFGGP